MSAVWCTTKPHKMQKTVVYMREHGTRGLNAAHGKMNGPQSVDSSCFQTPENSREQAGLLDLQPPRADAAWSALSVPPPVLTGAKMLGCSAASRAFRAAWAAGCAAATLTYSPGSASRSKRQPSGQVIVLLQPGLCVPFLPVHMQHQYQ